MRTSSADVDARRTDLLGAWAGLAFAVVVVAWLAMVLQGPSLTEPATSAQAWLADNAGLSRSATFVIVLGLLFLLLPFAAMLAGWLERDGEKQQALVRVMLAGVVISIVMYVMDAFGAVVLALGGRAAELSSAQFELAWDEARLFILTGFHLTMGLWVVAASIALLRTNFAPRWVGWLGVALLVPQVVAASWVVGGEVTALHDGLGGVGVVGSFLVWIPAVSVAMLRDARSTTVVQRES